MHHIGRAKLFSNDKFNQLVPGGRNLPDKCEGPSNNVANDSVVPNTMVIPNSVIVIPDVFRNDRGADT